MDDQTSHGFAAVSISVCIATFRRPALLANLLQSLAGQRGAPPFEVVVVDNDGDASAAPVVRRFADRLAVRYEVEPQRGLARARNRSVAASRGAFLAFIDDDETAPPAWLATLARVRAATRAAAVFGPVIVDCDPAIPAEIRACRLLRPRTAVEGAMLDWRRTSTANAYVDRAALPAGEPPFRCHFDRTGGEDVDLFRRMAKAGARYACGGSDAAVREIRERARSDLAWVIRRSIRNGGNQADQDWAGKSRAARAKLALKALGKSLAHLRSAWRARRSDRLAHIEGLIDACENAGRALSVIGYRLPEYAR